MSDSTKIHFADVHTGPGLQIWKIENLVPVPLPLDHYGQFLDTSSYIVLHVSLRSIFCFVFTHRSHLHRQNSSQSISCTQSILGMGLR